MLYYYFVKEISKTQLSYLRSKSNYIVYHPIYKKWILYIEIEEE
jgi:hypothetical protein